MKMKLIGFFAILSLALALGGFASAQDATKTTASKILYHDGTVLIGDSHVYFIWYGCWGTPGCGDAASQSNDAATQQIMTDFVSNVWLSPYLMIDAGYPDLHGYTPSGVVYFGGATADYYSHGPALSEADVESIVAGALKVGSLPADPIGIYVVLASSDVSVDDTATHLCLTCCQFHRHSIYNGTGFRYVFVGNPSRCPTGCAANFVGKPSPNANYAADAMASWLAHSLNGVLTNPDGTGWYDRYGLENADKCAGAFGSTYTITNPDGQTAQANVQLGIRHYLLEENWLNSRKGHCAMSYLQ